MHVIIGPELRTHRSNSKLPVGYWETGSRTQIRNATPPSNPQFLLLWAPQSEYLRSQEESLLRQVR